MTTPFWCLTIAVFFPYLLSSTAGYFKIKQFGRYDNKTPRLQAAQLEGMGSRACAAQQNTWEALIVFTPAVLIAHLAGANVEQSAWAAIGFVGARLVYMLAYLADWALFRTLVFSVGFVCCLWLFYLAAIV